MGNYAHAWILVAFFVTTDLKIREVLFAGLDSGFWTGLDSGFWTGLDSKVL